MPKESKDRALFKYVKRNLLLYAIWFVILLPITLHVRESWFYNGIGKGLLRLLKEFFLGDTFLASWFIMASIIATVIVYLLSQKVNSYVLLSITGALNLLCCLTSNYRGIYVFDKLNQIISPIIGNIRNNFVVALFWISLGMVFALKKVAIRKKTAIVGLVISAVLLFAESKLTEKFLDASGHSDCYFLLIPICFFIFALLLCYTDIKLKHAKFFRKSSTLIYVMHYAIIICLEKFTPYFGNLQYVIKFFAASILALICSVIIIRLSNNSKLKFIRYLY